VVSMGRVAAVGQLCRWMAVAPVLLLDKAVRRLYGIFEYWDDPRCLFRVRAIGAPHALLLPGQEVPAGAPVVELHFWNEHIPPLPEEGPDPAWALRFRRMVVDSFRHLADVVRHDPRLAGVQAVGATTVLFDIEDNPQMGVLLKRFGFSIYPHRSRLGRFGTIWENLYTWWLMAAFDAPSSSRRNPFRMVRTEIWMPIDELMGRFG